jgi:hypothetical protein
MTPLDVYVDAQIEQERARIMAEIEAVAHPDEWGVPCVYVDRLLKIVSGDRS